MPPCDETPCKPIEFRRAELLSLWWMPCQQRSKEPARQAQRAAILAAPHQSTTSRSYPLDAKRPDIHQEPDLPRYAILLWAVARGACDARPSIRPGPGSDPCAHPSSVDSCAKTARSERLSARTRGAIESQDGLARTLIQRSQWLRANRQFRRSMQAIRAPQLRAPGPKSCRLRSA